MLQDRFEQDGVKYGWSGFIETAGSPDIYGIWVCSTNVDNGASRAAATTLGFVGTMRRGCCIPLDVFDGGQRLQRDSPEEDKQYSKNATLERLTIFMKEAPIALDK